MGIVRRKIRYGVIGLGNIAQVAVLPAFKHSQNCELTALFSSDPAKLKKLGKKYGVKHLGSYDQLEELAAEGALDALYIALPNHLHCIFTERAAAAGLHVLCEKPMALDEAECRRMITACEKNRVKLMIAYRLHFEASNLRAMELVRKGKIGSPQFFSSVFCHKVRPSDVRTSAQMGGGALYDLGVYCINAARYLFESEPVEVFGLAFSSPERGNVDDVTAATLRFADGQIAQFTVGQGSTSVGNYRVSGAKGDLLLDPAFSYAQPVELTLTVDDKAKKHRFAKRDQFAPELMYFANCILNKREPEPSGYEGMADIRVVSAILRSIDERQAISLRLPRALSKVTHPQPAQEMYRPAVGKVKPFKAPSPSLA